MSVKLYRVQAADGRGPFRPGFSRQWRDRVAHGEELPPWYIEMPHVLGRLKVTTAKYAFGTGCKSPEQLKAWFSKEEYYRLVLLGYSAVQLDADKVYGESQNQCVFGRRRPLRKGVRRFDLYADHHCKGTGRG